MGDFPNNYKCNLPSGWEENVSPEGRVFYVDHSSHKTQWHHPITGKRKRVVAGLPPGWERIEGENGRTKFFNKVKNISTHIDPRLPIVLEEKEFDEDTQQNESVSMPYQFSYFGYALNVTNPFLINPSLANQIPPNIPIAPDFGISLGMNNFRKSGFKAEPPFGKALNNLRVSQKAEFRGTSLKPIIKPSKLDMLFSGKGDEGPSSDQGPGRNKGNDWHNKVADNVYRNPFSNPRQNNQQKDIPNNYSREADFPPQKGPWTLGNIPPGIANKEPDFPKDRMPGYPAQRDIFDSKYSVERDRENSFPPRRDMGNPDAPPARDHKEQDFPLQKGPWTLGNIPPGSSNKEPDFPRDRMPGYPAERDILDPKYSMGRDRGNSFPPRKDMGNPDAPPARDHRGQDFPLQKGPWTYGNIPPGSSNKEPDFPRDRMPGYPAERDILDPKYSMGRDRGNSFPPRRDMGNPDAPPARDHKEQDFPLQKGPWTLGNIPPGSSNKEPDFPRDRIPGYPAERDILDPKYSMGRDKGNSFPPRRDMGNPDTPPARDHRGMDFPPRRDLRDPDIPPVRDFRGQDFPPMRGFEEPNYPYNRDSRVPDFSVRSGTPEAGLPYERERTSYSPQRAGPDSACWGSSGRDFQDQPGFRKHVYPDDLYNSRSDRTCIDRRGLPSDHMESGRYSWSEGERSHRDLSMEFSGPRSQERKRPVSEGTKFSHGTMKRDFPDETEWSGKRSRFDYGVNEGDTSHGSYRDVDMHDRREYCSGRKQRFYDGADPPYFRGSFDHYSGARENRGHPPYAQSGENYEVRGQASFGVQEQLPSTYPDKGVSFERGHDHYSYRQPRDVQRFDPVLNLPSSSNKQNTDYSGDYPSSSHGSFDDEDISEKSGLPSDDDFDTDDDDDDEDEGAKGNHLEPNKKVIGGRNEYAGENVLVMKSFTVAVVPQGFPRNGSLTRNLAEEAKNRIVEKIDLLEPGERISPRFSKCNYRVGALMVTLLDYPTREWLHNILNEGNIILSNGLKLILRGPRIVRGHGIVGGLFPIKFPGDSEFLRILASGNPGIDTSRWCVMQADAVPHGVIVSLGVPKPSIGTLDKIKYFVRYNNDTIQLSIMSKKNSGKRPPRRELRKLAENIAIRNLKNM